MKEKKSLFITCNCKTKCSIYPFFLPILCIFIRYLNEKIFEECRPSQSYKILKYNLPYLFYTYLPKILSGVFIPIIKLNTRNKSIAKDRNSIIKRRYHYISENKSKKKMLQLFYLITLFEVIQETGDCLLYYYQKWEKLGWLVEKKTMYIIFVPIFCYLILDQTLHKHHLLAVILGIVGSLIINFFRFLFEFSYFNEFIFHILNIFFSLLFSFALVLIKYAMVHYLLSSPYIFLFYEGVFCILNSFICILLEYIVVINLPDHNKDEKYVYFKNNFLGIFTIFVRQKGKFYIFFILSFILSFFYYIIYAFTIYNYSPYLIIIVEACLPIDSDIIPIFFGEYVDKKEKKILRSICQLAGYIILFFSALILDEIIILNFFGFCRNTFYEISSRATIDSIDKNQISPLNEENSDNCSEN